MDSISLYNYTNNLFELFGKSKTASLYFEHVVFIPHDYFDPMSLTATNPKNNKTIKFSLDSNPMYARQILNYMEKSDCLSKHVLDTNIHANKFAHIHGIQILTNNGKSVYNTDLCDGINQHVVSNLVDKAKGEIRVPTVLGYTSHLRENTNKYFTNQVMDINHLFIDFEYYMYLWRKLGTDLLQTFNMTID